MDNEKSLGILEFRKWLFNNLDKYSLTDLKSKLEKLEIEKAKVKDKYKNNNKVYEDELWTISFKVATYRLAIKKMPIYEPIELKLSKDGMQYSLF